MKTFFCGCLLGLLLGLQTVLFAQISLTDSSKRQQVFEQYLDSLRSANKKYPKNLLKLQWWSNRRNADWFIPNGLCYERIWGKNSTLNLNLFFMIGRTSIPAYALYGETRYYLRSRKNQHTFNGFFLRGGLVYAYQEYLYLPNFKPVVGATRLGGVLGGFGYQKVWWKKVSTAAFFATSVGVFEEEYRKSVKIDAFQWNELGVSIGYAF